MGAWRHRSTIRTRRTGRSRRGNATVQHIATAFARSPLKPSAISLLSIAFVAAGAAALLWLPPWGAWLCALNIQLRLLCSSFDGMVAVEGGKSTPTGALYNEVPNRVTDNPLLLVSRLGTLS